MTEEEANQVLKDVAVVQVAVAAMQEIKRMREQCLAADIPAMMKRPEAKGGG